MCVTHFQHYIGGAAIAGERAIFECHGQHVDAQHRIVAHLWLCGHRFAQFQGILFTGPGKNNMLRGATQYHHLATALIGAIDGFLHG